MPECANCQDTGRVATDVPGRAGPLITYCFKDCAAAKKAIALDEHLREITGSYPFFIPDEDKP